MKFLIITLLLFLPMATVKAETIPYLDPLPIHEGFQVIEDDILVFDKPEGQIVEVSLWCDKNCPNPHDVYIYYRKIFLNLGWEADDVMGFYKAERSVVMELQQTEKNNPSIIITFHSKG